MRKLIGLIIALPLLLAVPAQAEFSGGVTLASEYILRGISLSDEEPAIQGNIDFVKGGFYLGVWGSNAEFGPGTDTQLEIDPYIGYVWEWDSGFSLDLGAIHYDYPSDTTDFSYEEYYVGLGFNGFELIYYYADAYLGTEGEGHYIDAAWKGGIGGGFNLGLHVGQSIFDEELVGLLDYVDYRVSLDRDFGALNVEVGYTDTDENQLGNLDDGRAYLLLSMSTP